MFVYPFIVFTIEPGDVKVATTESDSKTSELTRNADTDDDIIAGVSVATSQSFVVTSGPSDMADWSPELVRHLPVDTYCRLAVNQSFYFILFGSLTAALYAYRM